MTIERNDGIKHGRPTLSGSKLSVIQMLELIESGVSPAEIANSYSGIDDAEQVERALAWTEEHDTDVAELREQREEAKERVHENAENYLK